MNDTGMDEGSQADADATVRFSDILIELARDESRERVSVGDLFHQLGDRAYGALMLTFALPNIVPTPPGTSAITGTPLVFLSARLALGLQPWLPGFILYRSMARSDFAVVVNRVMPWLMRTEALLKPRLSFLTARRMDHLTGFVCFCLAVVLALPIPLANILPAISICLFSLGLIERDGVFTLAGFAVAIASIAVAGGVIFAFFKAAVFLLARLIT
ncbi:MAG: exopolysaccharide biosynthesis protein [Proteobacteria bacterium]|nr:exopolysaccharide biosynthesis protein [Pseudomonadota bacterium]